MRLIEQDFGTPEVSSDRTVELWIDNVPVTVPEGTSIMRAAKMVDVEIPKLCATDRLDAFGSCRLCLVEIEGRRGPVASCTEPASEGMSVRTQTQEIANLRRGVMELYISDHPLDCLTCAANGDCELQDMAGSVGLRDVRYEVEEDHLALQTDQSGLYFDFDPSKCIVCSRCVRACDEIQGTFALTVDGRGFDSKIATSSSDFASSECVSCGACVQACPTSTLMEKSVIEIGVPDRTVLTTCAYCGVGCSFKAELKGDQVVRMVPYKEGGANAGASCVKGRFAWGYANHHDRVTKPLIREKVTDAWREVEWDEAIEYTASRLKAIQSKYGRKSIGGVTSARTTIEEIYVVQKLVRTAFQNNNVDTCARVCHSPTGYGLKQTFGTSAGTQDFESVDDSDVIVVIGANPTEGHPVFGSRIKQVVRRGAQMIIVDPRKIDLVRSPNIEAAVHLPIAPGTNVPLMNAFAHVVVRDGLWDEEFVANRCELDAFEEWREFALRKENSPEHVAGVCHVDALDIEKAARIYAAGTNASIYYGLGVTEHSQGSTMVMAMANIAMATGNIGRPGVGVNPLRGQNNVQGSCDVGSFPHELPGYMGITDPANRKVFGEAWGVQIDPEPGYRIPQMFDMARSGKFKGMFIQGEDFAQSDPDTKHVEAALTSLECLIVQDLFLTETAAYAHVFFPATSFLEKDGIFINAERRMNRVRAVTKPLPGKHEWEIVQELSTALGYPMNYESTAEIIKELADTTTMFAGLSHERLDELGSAQWPINSDAPTGTPIMHVDGFVRGKGMFHTTQYQPTTERANRKFPLLLTTGRKLYQYNVGTQTRRTDNNKLLDQDTLEIHPSDAELRGIRDGDWVSLSSRMGETVLAAEVTERVAPGVVYTTFHHPGSGTNVITTDQSDWATNCPEYKVTAVEVRPSNHLRGEWQENYSHGKELQRQLLPAGG